MWYISINYFTSPLIDDVDVLVCFKKYTKKKVKKKSFLKKIRAIISSTKQDCRCEVCPFADLDQTNMSVDVKCGLHSLCSTFDFSLDIFIEIEKINSTRPQKGFS